MLDLTDLVEEKQTNKKQKHLHWIISLVHEVESASQPYWNYQVAGLSWHLIYSQHNLYLKFLEMYKTIKSTN